MATAKSQAEWVKMKPEEVKKKIVELAKQNIPPAKIGVILRDEHGIPKTKVFGKKMGQMLKEEGIELNTESDRVNQKIDTLKKHFEAHKHDYDAQRSIVKNMARLNKLKKQQAAKTN